MTTKVVYVLVIMLRTSSGNISPDVIEEHFNSPTRCWSVGFALKMRAPDRIAWFNCHRIEINETE